MIPPLVPFQPLVVDENVLPEFHDAIRSLGDSWTAPSGRTYALVLDGDARRMVVGRAPADVLEPASAGPDVDDDLLELGQAIYAAMGGEWAAVRLRQLAAVWTGTPVAS